MDSTFPPTPPSILLVEDDAQSREAIARALTRAGYEAILAASGDDALNLMAAAEFGGLYCVIELPGRADGWEVGSTFSFIWPDRPVVYASATSVAPGRLRKGVFLRKPFLVAMLARAFGPAQSTGAAGRSAPQPLPEKMTAARIKPAGGFVHLS